MVGGLLSWLDEPSAERGLRFADEEGGWSFDSYADLALWAGSAAAQIEDERAGPGRPVVIVLPTGPAFVAAYFGAVLAGDVPCPVPPPGPTMRPDRYREHLAGILAVAQPSLVVTDETLEEPVAEACAAAGVSGPRLALRRGAEQPRARRLAPLWLLQFTSGSSGRPRGVQVARENLEANLASIHRWIDLRPDDAIASWLPLFHDMGLIGMLFTPVRGGVDAWLMRPEQFVQRPALWLECFGRHGATIAGGPTFGLGFARRRVAEAELEGLDFSRWRIAITAAERLDPAVLAGFAAWLAPHGFRARALLPAYGLAEATLAVCGGTLDVTPRAVRIDVDALEPGRAVEVLERCTLEEPDAIGQGAGWLVECGRPFPRTDVTICDEDGTALPEGHFGEIRIAGEGVTRGYLGDTGTGSTRYLPGGGIATGDAGFMLDGELYVVGRMGDSVKVRGRNVYMEDLEAELAVLPGVGRGRVVAIPGADDHGPLVCALVEAEPGDWVDAVVAALARAVGGACTVRVLHGPRGTIERTSSGKPRRRVMWRALMDGSLAAGVAAEVPATGATRPAPAAAERHGAPA